MNGVLDALAGPVGRNLAWTLLHSLWQGAALTLLLVVVLKAIPARRATSRYVASLAALFALVFCTLITWSVMNLEVRRAASTPTAPTAFSVAASPETSPGERHANAPAIRSGEPNAHRSRDPRATSRQDVGRVAAGDSSESAHPARQPSHRPATEPWWIPTIVLAWTVGVIVMLARVVRQVVGAEQLGRGSPVIDPAVHEILQRLSDRLGLTRRIDVVSNERLSSPAVVGVLRPVLVLPMSLMTGLAPDQLEAILAHELAHIRRHDYLVNLGQMLIEALWFFNPAVWWISRQVRVEREACCDQLAVEHTRAPLSYVQTLAAWAERTRRATPVGSPAFADPTDRGSLLDRVRRLISTDYQPQTRLSVTGLAMSLAIAALLLVVLNTGSNAVVDLAARVLSPQERIRQITAVRGKPASEEDADQDKVTLRGTIHTEDGHEITGPVWMYSRTRSKAANRSALVGSFRDSFTAALPPGITWISFWYEGYAPAFVGPFDAAKGEKVNDIRIVLTLGNTVKIRVNNPQDQGIPRARIIAVPNYLDSELSAPTGDHWTDGSGRYEFRHLAGMPYQLTVTAPGYQRLRTEAMSLEAGGTISLVLQPAHITSGTVLSHEGEPIAGARIKEYRRFGGGQNTTTGDHGPVVATTDDSGRFRLDQLSDTVRYAFLVETDAFGRAVFNKVLAGQTDLKWVVGPDRWLQGTVVGDLSKLKLYRNKPSVTYRQPVRSQTGPANNPTLHVSYLGNRSAVRVDDQGVGHFEIHGLYPGEVTITAGDLSKELTVSDDSPLVVKLDLDKPLPQPETRKVTLRLVSGEGPVPPEGKVRLRRRVAKPGRRATWVDEQATVIKGQLDFETAVPALITVSCEPMIGYWFNERVFDIAQGEGDVQHTIQVVPAGAISGKLVQADGSPAASGHVNVGCRIRHKQDNTETITHVYDKDLDANGQFFLSPIPLGAQCIVSATTHHNIAVAPPLTIDGAQATRKVLLKLPPAVTARGQVLGSDGSPLAGIHVSLSFQTGPSYSHNWQGEETDSEGQFRFENVNQNTSQYHIVISSDRDWQPARQRLEPDGQPTIVRLKRGLVVEGTVLDDNDQPVPGAEVYAMRRELDGDHVIRHQGESLTDAEGRFRFSNLPDALMRFYVQGMQFEESVGDIVPGESRDVVLRGKVHDWLRDELQAPADFQP